MRKRRLDLGLLQRQVAESLGVSKGTIVNWERNATTPALHLVPGIIRFLGYVPFPPGLNLSEKLKARRRALGLSQETLAKRLGVDPGTVARWEKGRSRPAERVRKQIRDLVSKSLLSGPRSTSSGGCEPA